MTFGQHSTIMTYPTEQSIISYFVLLINLGFSLFGSTITNLSTYSANKRPHNFIRLVNEALTRLYLSYFSFFLLLVLVLLNQNAGSLKIILNTFIAISSLLIWGVSLYITSIFSDLTYIQRFHGCIIKDNQCSTSANFRDFLKVCFLNILIGLIIFLLVSAILLFTPLLRETPKQIN